MTIELNKNFWDCECAHNFIHSKKEQLFCPKCKTFEKDQPDSHINEIKQLRLMNSSLMEAKS